jgi:hypothetical protein
VATHGAFAFDPEARTLELRARKRGEDMRDKARDVADARAAHWRVALAGDVDLPLLEVESIVRVELRPPARAAVSTRCLP